MKLLLAIVAAIALSACGGGSSSPTTPTPPPQPPNIQGQWLGTYTITNCAEAGAAIGTRFCAELGTGGRHSISQHQTGGSLSGTVAFGSLSIEVTGSVDTSNVVMLAGSGPSSDVVRGSTLNLTQWRGTMAGNQITGTMSFAIVTTSPTGSVTIVGTFSLTR